MSENILRLFEYAEKLSTVAHPKQGSTIGNNDKFLRFWWEVQPKSHKWFPCLKGGDYRKWYGNKLFVINWENGGSEIRSTGKETIRNAEYIFKPCIEWGRITSSDSSFRIVEAGYFFESASGVLFPDADRMTEILGFLNSKVVITILVQLNPTLTAQSGDIARLPVLKPPPNTNYFSYSCVTLARADWDNFETSWDFRDFPLLRKYEVRSMKDEKQPMLDGNSSFIPHTSYLNLESAWQNWSAYCQRNIDRMQELETENNRLFIDAYGLQDELSPEVPESQITLARADRRKDMAAFLSYAIGCMMGRYSLDAPGLILADAGSTIDDYYKKVASIAGTSSKPNAAEISRHSGMDRRNPDCMDASNTRHPWSLGSGAPCRNDGVNLNSTALDSEPAPTFPPDEDGILPLLDGEWFEDDIVARTREFLRATFGEAGLRDNIRFIEESLGKDLRKYFLTDFYKDHLQTYKKRPIYWLVQSPKKGFSVLIYLHRYTKDTMNLVLNRYLRPYQDKLRNRLAQLAQMQTSESISTRDKTAARKEADKLGKILHECEEWERQTVLPLAQQRIELDLDDGVKVNYLKLGEALAPIPGLAGKDSD